MTKRPKQEENNKSDNSRLLQIPREYINGPPDHQAESERKQDKLETKYITELGGIDRPKKQRRVDRDQQYVPGKSPDIFHLLKSIRFTRDSTDWDRNGFY